jgi:radical SAM protein with 4Fe4S-binding SPASM domain
MKANISKATQSFLRKQLVPEGYSLRHTGDLFTHSWDMEAVKKEIIRARLADDIPRFELNKVELHVFPSCNLKCSFCYGKKVRKAKKERLSRASVRSILNDIRVNMPDSEPLLILAGLYSEPLLHPEILEILEDLGERKFRFGIYTNGLLLDARIAAAIAGNAEKNKDGNFPSYISFNVTATMDRGNLGSLRDKDELRKKQLEIIRDFSKCRSKEKVVVNASLLALPHRSGYRQIVDELDRAGVDNIRLSFPWVPHRNPMARVFGGLTREEYEERRREFSVLKNLYSEKVSVRLPSGRLRHCFVMSQSLAISSEGDIFPCPEVSSLEFQKTHSYGSIHTDNPVSKIWGGRQHHARFLELDPDEARCECCHVDRELNEGLARYWEDSGLHASSVEESPFGVFEWQWAGESWYGKVVLDGGTNTVTTARVGRLTKEYDGEGSFHFRMGEVVLDLVEGSFEVLDRTRIRMKLKVRRLGRSGDMNDEHVEGVLYKTQCFAGEVEYLDSKRDTCRYGGMVLVKHESIIDESVRNWFLDSK